jgi:quercetin dioxygenase-like cupin family protein
MSWVYRSEAEAEAGRIVEEWGSLNWLSGEALTGSDVTVGRVIIKKGMSNPQHVHPNCTELLYMLSGTLEHTVGGETVVTSAGDTIIVPAGVVHVARNVGDRDADMIVAYPSGRRGFQVMQG